ncbi:hypothetical protein SAY86_009794 [Trapa natans]|uniref:S-protein homolog n=1 Tax=Trapa natans TaxID=22666 RepID=A0AAN7QQ01_TRANT|nr:hypothetical protein SAY86_009794 [Trapa natans]
MMPQTKCTLLLLLIPLFLLVEIALGQSKVYVEVYNNLPPGSTFAIQCKSRDDNLGVHILAPNQVYSFHFGLNVIGTTLYYCRLRSAYGQGVYDFYKNSRDYTRCTQVCTYKVTPVGVFAYSDGRRVPDFVFRWK